MTQDDRRRDDLAEDVVYDLLSRRIRRELLDVLRGTDTATREGVAAQLAGAEGDRADGFETDGGAERLEVELHHVHLPKMAEAGVIEYDGAGGTIRTTEGADRLRERMDALAPGAGG